jgi:hypothetical protein
VVSLSFLTREPNSSAINTEAGHSDAPYRNGAFNADRHRHRISFLGRGPSLYLAFYAKKGKMRTLIKTPIDILSGVSDHRRGAVCLSIFTRTVVFLFELGGRESGRRRPGATANPFLSPASRWLS